MKSNKLTLSLRIQFYKHLIIYFVFFMLFATQYLYAAEDIYRFNNLHQQQRFALLTSTFRCLVCQNQNLAESNAPLASDLRQQIYQKIQNEQSDQEIINYLVARYGHYVLYKPPFDMTTIVLWVSPFLLLFTGMSYLIFYIRHKKS